MPSPLISFGLYNSLEEKRSCTVTSNVTLQPFAKLDDLKTHYTAPAPFATFEPDYWLLDGGTQVLPDDDTGIHTGVVGTELSDATGAYTTVPYIEITSPIALETDGIKLYLPDDYFYGSITVLFSKTDGTLIREDVYAPTEAGEFFTDTPVSNFGKVRVSFDQTSVPYRFMRVRDIDLANMTYFDGTVIKSCEVVEQINPVAEELPSNSLDFHLFTRDPQFSIIEPQGGYTHLQYRNPLFVHERVDNDLVYIGAFYLEAWENLSTTEIVVHAIDMIGVLGTLDFDGLWTGITAIGFLGDQLLTPIGVAFDLDTSLREIFIKGWLPISTYREALHQFCMAIGAYATCARSGVIRILPMTLAEDIVTPDATLTAAHKSLDGSLKLKTQVTGVEVKSHDYDFGGVSREIFNTSLPVGQHKIIFDSPQYTDNMTVTGATVVTKSVNYIVVDVAVEGVVTVTVENINDSSRLEGIYTASLQGAQHNIIKIEEATFLRSDILGTTIQRIYDYHQQRYSLTTTLYAPAVEVGDQVHVDTLYGRRLAGIIEKMELDLSGGFRAKTEIVGIILPEA